jgi:urease accessory protein
MPNTADPPANAANNGDGAPPLLCSTGEVRVSYAHALGSTHLNRVYESGFLRLRMTEGGGCEGVLINTAGGLNGGDAASLEVHLDHDARTVLTTAAAEKIYRSEGAATRISAKFGLADGARLDWLPQETILFDHACLERSLDVAMGNKASLNLIEIVVLGRSAHGEVVRGGKFRDCWRIRRGERLVFADDVHLEGDFADLMRRKAVGTGAAAVATVLQLAPEAELRLAPLRAALADVPCEWGASARPGYAVARFLGREAAAVRTAAARAAQLLTGTSLPRSWSC